MVHFDHDFIGREAPMARRGEPNSQRSTVEDHEVAPFFEKSIKKN